MQYHRYGGPEVLQLEELAVPEPGRGELRVRVTAATLPLAEVVKGHEMLASKRSHGKIIISIGDSV